MRIYKMIIATIVLVVLIAATAYCLLNTGYAVHNGVVYNDNAQSFMILAIGFGFLTAIVGLVIVAVFEPKQEDDDE